MPSNKHLVPDRTTILKTKVNQLSKKLQRGVKAGEFTTQEQILFEATRLVNQLYKDLTEPLLELEEVKGDDPPNSEVYNTIWNTLLDDLVIVFSELENLETLTLTNFNYVITESNRLTSRLKSVSSKLGDYILYSESPTKDLLYFKDSFNDLSKVDTGSSILNLDECNVDQVQGIATLPIDIEKDSRVIIKASPIINSNSNGVNGNNQQIGAVYNGDPAVLLDDNPDTWFEYERVVTFAADTKDPLVLDLTMNLGDPAVVNHIRINPNNFGTKTVIQIDRIETSLDGQVYTSIKDDIPIADFLTEDEENVFTLAPSTSKFAGQGIYSFTPRKVKYIHIVFKQPEPYVISTPNGDRLRYAIGIRDIDIKSISYLNEGEIVSQPFFSIEEIKKVLLDTNQNPIEYSELGGIQYFVSPDDGSTWHEIQSKQFTGESGVVSVPEVLSFNSIEANSIQTSIPVNSVRLKARFFRNDDAFVEGSSSFNKTIVGAAETHPIPNTSPFNITLERSPVEGSIVVVDPMFGSRGIPDQPYYLNYNTQRMTNRKFRLPFTTLPRPLKKVLSGNRYHTEPVPASEWIHVEVVGTEWTHITDAFSAYSGTDKVYKLDTNTGILEFGDGTDGKLPSQDDLISLYFDAERLHLTETEDAHKGELSFATTSNQDLVTIKRYDKVEYATQLLPRGATIVSLEHSNIIDTTQIETLINSLPGSSTKVTYQNGKDELVLATDWSIDTTAGIIYLATPTPTDETRLLGYTYQPIYILSNDEWSWGTTKLLRDSVIISEDAWKILDVEDESIEVAQNINTFDLANLSVVPTTLLFTVTIGGTVADPESEVLHPFVKEVPYQDGFSELKKSVTKVTEDVVDLSAGLNTVTFSNTAIDNTTEYKPIFSYSTVFVTEVGITPAANGEYRILSGTTGYEVYTDVALKTAGTVTYYRTREVPNAGLYSINYKDGKVYTQRTLDPNNDGNWTITVDYKYSDYRAEYQIARRVDPKQYKIDITNSTITFLDGEINQRALLVHSRPDNGTPYYLVNYDYVGETRENINELQNLFTPVLKDYIIKVLPKGRIF